MNKNDIISAVSIEFGLSKEQSEKVVSGIFNSIGQTLKKDRCLEIKKFGKFKITPGKDTGDKFYYVKFTPSEKLSKRVNSNFENLKKIKQKIELNGFKEKSFEFIPDRDIILPAEIIRPGVNEMQSGSNVIKNDEQKITVSDVPMEKSTEHKLSGQRKLISEDLIKLHKEITEIEKPVKDKGGESSDNNLWG